MINIEFTSDSLNQVRKLLEHSNKLVRRKALVLILKSEKMPHKQIARIVGVTEDTITSYLKSYMKGGLPELILNKYRKPESSLEPFNQSIMDYFDTNPPQKLKTSRT